MSDRKAELERKRKRLEEIRRARNEKKKTEQETAKQAASTTSSLETETQRKQRETDELLKGILPDDVIDGSAGTAAIAAVQKSASTKQPSSPVKKPLSTETIQKKVPVLVVSQTAQTNIPPKEPVLYSKETQTPTISNQKDEEEEEIIKTPKPEIIEVPEPVAEEHKEEPPIIELSDDQKEQILNSQEFGRFFDKATRLIERALCEDIDIFMDYSGNEEDDQDKIAKASSQLTLGRKFYDERWSKHRTITCLDWSTQYPELLVASYNNNEDLPHEPDGVALIWNLKYSKTTPEYVFHCQSAVMSATFAEFHPNLIIGGTYSGQIVLWDNRSSKRTPVQRTPLSATAHTHPVYCVNVVGTQNAHNLISVSTDGKMCSWSLDMLSQPQDNMELQYTQSKPVAVTCMSFMAGDVNNFVVGSEEGTVYTACRHGTKAGMNILQ